MIHTCEICGNDFLTEADCFVVRPTANGNKLYCYCQIKGFDEINVMEKLKTENIKLRECLKNIANEDYRGNRSNSSVKAYLCLKELDEK